VRGVCPGGGDRRRGKESEPDDRVLGQRSIFPGSSGWEQGIGSSALPLQDMDRLRSLPRRACPAAKRVPAWEIPGGAWNLYAGTTRFRPRHVVDYKALPKTTSDRKRVRRTRVLADRPVQPALEEMSRVLARELHDSVAQTLSAMLVELENFRAEQYGRAGVQEQVTRLEQSTRKALSDLRRLLVELRGRRVGEEDLVKLVKLDLLERQGRARRVEFGLKVASDWPVMIPAANAAELHRMIAEAIENALRHSGAKKIDVALGFGLSGHSAVLTINDDGRGLPKDDESRAHSGLGILGMRERAHLLGGEIELDGGLGGRGTTVRITVPLSTLGWG
jgi:signal transduction histidine kinase